MSDFSFKVIVVALSVFIAGFMVFVFGTLLDLPRVEDLGMAIGMPAGGVMIWMLMFGLIREVWRK